MAHYVLEGTREREREEEEEEEEEEREREREREKEKEKEEGERPSINLHPFLYNLHSIIVHEFRGKKDHYSVYVLNERSSGWSYFSDEKTPDNVTRRDVIEKTFGGDDSQQTAFVLVYLLQEQKNSILGEPNLEEVQSHALNLDFEKEAKRDFLSFKIFTPSSHLFDEKREEEGIEEKKVFENKDFVSLSLSPSSFLGDFFLEIQKKFGIADRTQMRILKVEKNEEKGLMRLKEDYNDEEINKEMTELNHLRGKGRRLWEERKRELGSSPNELKDVDPDEKIIDEFVCSEYMKNREKSHFLVPQYGMMNYIYVGWETEREEEEKKEEEDPYLTLSLSPFSEPDISNLKESQVRITIQNIDDFKVYFLLFFFLFLFLFFLFLFLFSTSLL
jgi:hypothetical protein